MMSIWSMLSSNGSGISPMGESNAADGGAGFGVGAAAVGAVVCAGT